MTAALKSTWAEENGAGRKAARDLIERMWHEGNPSHLSRHLQARTEYGTYNGFDVGFAFELAEQLAENAMLLPRTIVVEGSNVVAANDEQTAPLPASEPIHNETRSLRLPEVVRRLGVSRPTIYRMIAAGQFPKPRKLGGRVSVWSSSELDDWLHHKFAD